MPAFQRPFDPDGLRAEIVPLRLEDPRGDSAAARFARLSNVTLPFAVVTPAASGGRVAFRWPVTGSARHVDLTPEAQAALGVAQLVEVSPLPFAIAPTLRSLVPGLPTFYIGLTDVALPAHDHVVRISETPLDAGRAVIACVFQDRMSLHPAAWIDVIGRALDGGAPQDAAAWRALAPLFPAGTMHVRDAHGAPAAGETFALRFVDAGGVETRRATLTTDALGRLPADALPQAGERAELSWLGTPLPGDTLLPVLALYQASLGTGALPSDVALPGGGPLILPEGLAGGHLQILDLARWYADAVRPQGKTWPQRFHPASRMEPLVDGLAAFARLVPDMRGADGIHICGWAFNDFPLRPHEPESKLSDLLEEIGRDRFRILVARFFMPQIGALDDLTEQGFVALMAAMIAFVPPIVRSEKFADRGGIYGWLVLVALAATIKFALEPGTSLKAFASEAAEFTKRDFRDVLYDLSDGKPPCAFSAPHPARLDDNPLQKSLTLPFLGELSETQRHFGVFHHKFQLVAKPDPDEPLAGYLGGIDINRNRIDAPGHHAPRYRPPDSDAAPGPGAYHDVHARITGPATRDLAGIFQDRLAHALDFTLPNVEPDPAYTQPVAPVAPAFAVPDPGRIPAAGRHLVRISQTSFAPRPGGDGFPWAPDGDSTIRQNFERAIRAARDVIYIEDQYFTLDDGLIQLLRDAAGRCARLVIVVAANTSDQLFGNERRLATLERLAGATGGQGGWGDRMIVGAPFRRPVLPPAAMRASLGRARLLEDVTTTTAPSIFVGPVPRVPGGAPYFFWVGGELMFAHRSRLVRAPSGAPAKELEVLRGALSGSSPPFCPHPRTHKAGTPVTFAPPHEIFVHAKLLIVDDIFVGIGSSNWNRRGFYHDGEIDAFAIPEQLKAAADNPALALRTALWAEHLGLPPAMGRSLLADPLAAFELFRRSMYDGNRFQPQRLFTAPAGDLEALNDLEIFQALPEPIRVTLIAVLNAYTLTMRRDLWNLLVDPTSFADPNPREGPDLP